MVLIRKTVCSFVSRFSWSPAAQPAGPRPEASTSFGPRPCGFRNQPTVHRSPNISEKKIRTQPWLARRWNCCPARGFLPPPRPHPSAAAVPPPSGTRPRSVVTKSGRDRQDPPQLLVGHEGSTDELLVDVHPAAPPTTVPSLLDSAPLQPAAWYVSPVA